MIRLRSYFVFDRAKSPEAFVRFFLNTRKTHHNKNLYTEKGSRMDSVCSSRFQMEQSKQYKYIFMRIISF